jgi:hypothetical protein
MAGMGILAAAVAFVVVFPRTHLEATEIRPVALASTAATPADQRVVFYDNGQRRYDEVNQLEWYGDRFLIWPENQMELQQALLQPPAPVFIMDEDTYRNMVDSHVAHHVLARSGHLICIRLPQ